MSTLPLKGFRVVEVAEFLFVPCCGAVLADWGAEVIKIEQPQGGDRLRAVMTTGAIPRTEINHLWHQANRGKKSVTIDLRLEHGRELVRRLVKTADVFVTSFLGPARRKLGIEYEDIAKVNPSIVYCRTSGYGPRGKDRDRPGYDYSAYWARGGFALSLAEPDGPPVRQRPGLGDVPGAMFAAGGVAAALLGREKTGEGVLVDLSLLASAVWANTLDILGSHYAGVPVPRLRRQDMENPMWNTYQARDGRWLQLAMPQTDLFWPALCSVLGRPDLEHDPRFNSHEARCERHLDLCAIFDEIFATRDAKEWGERLEEAACIWALLQDVGEVLADEQVVANEYMPSVDGLKLVASPVQFNMQPPKFSWPGPELGQHTEEVLVDLGLDWDEIGRLKDEGVIL